MTVKRQCSAWLLTLPVFMWKPSPWPLSPVLAARSMAESVGYQTKMNRQNLSLAIYIYILFVYIYYRGPIGNQVLVNWVCTSISIGCLLANLPTNVPTGAARACLPAWVSRVEGPGDSDSAGCQLLTRHLNKRDPVFKERALVTLPGVSCQGLVLLSWQFYQALAPLIFFPLWKQNNDPSIIPGYMGIQLEAVPGAATMDGCSWAEWKKIFLL